MRACFMVVYKRTGSKIGRRDKTFSNLYLRPRQISMNTLVRQGNYVQLKRMLEHGQPGWPTISRITRDDPLSVAVVQYIDHLNTPLARRYKLTLQSVIDIVLAVRAPMFPIERNALHTLARRAKTQREYDAVARVFRQRVPNHFKVAHRHQYINVSTNGNSLSGRLSRASSQLAVRNINASINRPKTSGGKPLGASRARNAVPVVVSNDVLRRMRTI